MITKTSLFKGDVKMSIDSIVNVQIHFFFHFNLFNIFIIQVCKKQYFTICSFLNILKNNRNNKKTILLPQILVVSNLQPKGPCSIRLPMIWCFNHSAILIKKMRYLNAIYDFGHEFNDL